MIKYKVMGVIGFLVFISLGFVLVNHEKFWSGFLSDAMSPEEQDHAAASFNFEDYYGYDAAFSDLSRIFAGRDEAFVDRVLMRQKSYREKDHLEKLGREAAPNEAEYQKSLFLDAYVYHFEALYRCPFGCRPEARDPIVVTFKQNNFYSISIHMPGLMWSLHVQKKAKT